MREGRGGRISVPSAHSHIEPKWALFFIYIESKATAFLMPLRKWTQYYFYAINTPSNIGDY
jgi:hypothetical protein